MHKYSVIILLLANIGLGVFFGLQKPSERFIHVIEIGAHFTVGYTDKSTIINASFTDEAEAHRFQSVLMEFQRHQPDP